MTSATSATDNAAGTNAVVTVGVDGSEASRDALRWAAEYAQLRGSELRAVAAWEWPIGMGMALPLPETYNPLEEARSALQQTIVDVLGEAPAVPVTLHVVEGSPRTALVQASEDSCLLVVGSRGHGGFAGLLLGSTSEHCARHAHCPVVIVRHQKPAQ